MSDITICGHPWLSKSAHMMVGQGFKEFRAKLNFLASTQLHGTHIDRKWCSRRSRGTTPSSCTFCTLVHMVRVELGNKAVITPKRVMDLDHPVCLSTHPPIHPPIQHEGLLCARKELNLSDQSHNQTPTPRAHTHLPACSDTGTHSHNSLATTSATSIFPK